jgi:Zn finger protein HypA/HybF involved in hydrogenase expression
MAVENIHDNKNEAQCEKCLTVVRFLRSDVEEYSSSYDTSSGDHHFTVTNEYFYVRCPCCGKKIEHWRFKYNVY